MADIAELRALVDRTTTAGGAGYVLIEVAAAIRALGEAK